MNPSDTDQHYNQAKDKLNPEQRRAVETIEGPVMVLAGPGTGKTQVLAFRIAEILQQTDVSARNILALTFTESGVTAMRERLVSLIGVTAYGVGIYTFHSFANRVINDSGAEFYKSHSLDPIDDISQLKLVIEIVDELQNERIRPVRSPHFYVRPIVGAIKNLKNEGVSPEQLRTLCREEIEELTHNPESLSKSGKSKGDLKQKVKDTIEKLERSLALADAYERYQTEIETRGLYDYEDMILFVVQSLEHNPDLTARYQEQFQYILVDEYQDTNNAQNTLVRLLCDYFENPNLFVVGDDKQSIYRFQGASMANLLKFLEWYPSAELISLKENYRSGQPVLDRAHELINKNNEQLAKVLPQLATKLLAQNDEASVSFVTYGTPDSEALGIVGAVKKLLDEGTPAAEIALIYRNNSEAATFTDLLTRQSIGYHLEAGNDVLKDPDTRQLLNLLELAVNPNNEFALFRYLHALYSNIETRDLIAAGQWRKNQRTTWVALLDSDIPPEDLNLTTWSSMKDLRQRTCDWHRYQSSHNLGDTVEHIFLNSGFLTHLMEQPNHLERLHRLRCFFDEIKHIMNAVQFATLDNLFEQLEIRKTYNLPLVCSPMVQSSTDAIRLMTAHKSKGLEFSHVFIPHFLDGLWSNNRKNDLLTLPEGIVPHHATTDEQDIEEERRLFYVALTRAKKAVYLSYSEMDNNGKKQLPCQFLTELGEVTILTSESKISLPLSEFFSPIKTNFVEATSQAYLREIVTKQSITPTGLNNYLTCPLEYLYRNVYCIPGVREPFQAYGTAVHKALELWGNWSKTGQGDFGLNSILSVFSETLIKEGLTEDEVRRYQQLGHDVLHAYYEQFALTWIPPLATEYSFSPHAVMLDGKIPITGKIDKIEPIKGSKSVRVIDFKTGRVKSRNEIEGNTASSDGDYKRQLVFYAILAEADPFFPYTIGECALTFIDDQKKFTTEVFEISSQEKDELRALIRSVYGEITQLNFEHTIHKKAYNQGESLCDLLRADSLIGSSSHKSPETIVSPRQPIPERLH